MPDVLSPHFVMRRTVSRLPSRQGVMPLMIWLSLILFRTGLTNEAWRNMDGRGRQGPCR
ncbi:hypothetical protein RJY96_14480 [Brucella melitensis]|uniref:hypothetical protein n=1 Tax=Brucella TaxID=234 RepID=UPI0025531479|nr:MULTISPECIES: hypothetical protein [Brucella]MDT7997036.1 hypothetical protein [Brucella melitensis]MDT8004549.1 hypothetical protein [Brucella melitensis]MDT8020548.1 hypothetical protein [Brucella melitensis]MDT8035211.1 hypothetical protein [Brucella melitensis]MDT8056639.1 hypothetical protein [Brucella melitensis]